MTGMAKWTTIAIAAIALIVTLFFPRSASIPEWRLRVIDETGQPLAGAIVHQEWTSLEQDGMTSAGSKTTDGDGWVTLPARRIRSSWALQIQDHYVARSKGRTTLLSTHAFVCSEGKTGEIIWGDLDAEPTHRLQLHKGACGYG